MLGRAAFGGAGALALLLLVPAGGDATTLRPLPFAEVARRADRVVVATVAGTSCRLGATPAGRVRPFTDVDLRGISEVAGTVATRNLVLSIIGGTAGGRTTRVPGAPVLEPGRTYVLFLKSGEPLCGIVGWTQGVFRVEPDAAGTGRVLTHDGAPVASVSGGRVDTGGPPLALGPFLDAVWEARGAPPAAAMEGAAPVRPPAEEGR